MDLNQDKLSKKEWDNTELPVPQHEKEILKLIIDGYHDVNIIYNKNMSMINYIKLEPKENITDFLYNEYFKHRITKLITEYEIEFDTSLTNKIKRINSMEKLKLENMRKMISSCEKKVFEYYLLYIIEHLVQYYFEDDMTKFNKYYYTLYHLRRVHITNIIPKILSFVDVILENYLEDIDINEVFDQSADLIENNNNLTTYNNFNLYNHQKELFTICKNEDPKLILYIAPTGTGKTLSPLGLSETKKIIFVCAARHVGLALAKSAISIGKKIAFAFGCHDVSDIRLHYFAAKDYVKHSKTGTHIKYKDGSKKIDNTNGENVEIMICDIKSYICAMNYMNAFNDVDDMILYWDEPTITLDYDQHEFHQYITDNWKNNTIPNIILSSATLPHRSELQETTGDFMCKFENGKVYNIVSHDCNKSIPLVNSKNLIEMPHLKYSNYEDLQKCIEHCKKNLTLLRYFDLGECVKFISYLNIENKITDEINKITNKYHSLNELTMNNIKIHYLNVLEKINSDEWTGIYDVLQSKRLPKYKSNIHVATTDSHTLTDGPTIFLANNVEKISKFILQEIKMPELVIKDMMESIEFNDKIINILRQKERQLEDSLGDDVEKENKMIKDTLKPEQIKLKREIDELSKKVKTIALNDLFVPNKLEHLRHWANITTVGREFSCNIEPNDVEKIMLLAVDSSWKILLLMGIGVFTNAHDSDYTEIMKQLATEQKLYMIIASSDYIYGTNYQFCHGYISKDLGIMTQEKTIQAMGRIGRNYLHKNYSIRFRHDDLIEKIFTHVEYRPEVENMNKLFNTPI
jgi:hypothetical protein